MIKFLLFLQFLKKQSKAITPKIVFNIFRVLFAAKVVIFNQTAK